MDFSKLITNPYERKARLYPALLLISPMIATLVALLSTRLSGLQSLVAAMIGCGGAFLLTQLARDAGKAGEEKLLSRWGGLPSISILRHRDSRLDALTKARYHKKLASLVKEAKAPTIESEQANPKAVDEVYSAWSNYLRVHTRDTKKFALLFQENINYGYRRNVWGMRIIGIFLALLSLAICSARLYFEYRSSGKLDDAAEGAAAFAAIMLLLWLFRFSESWVRVPADAYAARLVECAETLGGSTSIPSALKKAPNT